MVITGSSKQAEGSSNRRKHRALLVSQNEGKTSASRPSSCLVKKQAEEALFQHASLSAPAFFLSTLSLRTAAGGCGKQESEDELFQG